MRKILFLLILFIALSIFGNITLKVGIYDDYPACYLENNKPTGFMVDLLNYIASKENWEIQYEYDAWTNLLDKLANGKIDVLLSVVQTPEREQLFYFNKIPAYLSWGIVVSKKPLQSFQDLANLKIGLIKKDFFSEQFLEKMKDNNINILDIIWVNSSQEILDLLEEQKIEAGVVGRIAAQNFLKKYDFVINENLICGFTPMMFAFKKDDQIRKTIIPKIDTYLNTLKINTNSYYWNIYEKYFNPRILSHSEKITLFMIITILLVVILIIFQFAAIARKKAYEKLTTLNKELEKYSNELIKYQNNLIDILTLLSKLITLKSKPEQFLKDIFKHIFKLIPKADTGSIFLIEEGKIKFIATKGYDLEKLQKLNIKREQFFIPEEIEILSGEEIIKMDQKSFSEEEIKILFPKSIKQIMFVPIKLSNETIGAFSLEIYFDNPKVFSENDKIILDSFSKIISIFYTLQKYSEFQGKFLKNVSLALIKSLETHDYYTKGHSERVAYYASKFAEKLGLDKNTISKLYWSALLHDIGKIAIPPNILIKPVRLTSDEFEIVKKHPLIAYDIVKDLEYFEDIPQIIKHHHERWDGKGYPDGLKGEEIPLEARILALADAFDAMTSDRPYRKKLTIEEAINGIIKNAGKQFDPELAKIFVEMIINHPEIVLEDNK